MDTSFHSADERDDVRIKSGQPVTHSGPGLTVGQTLSPTAGRKPEARLRFSLARDSGATCQPKSGRGAGRSTAIEFRGAAPGSTSTCASHEVGALYLNPMDEYEVRRLREFFELLDEWDRAEVKQ